MVTATLDRTTSAATTITVSAAAGAGAVAADFSLSNATTLTIAANATTSTGTVTITANDNGVASGNKQVAVSATAAGSSGVSAPPSATLTITDDETPQTTLLLSSSSISENDGVATVTARLDQTSSVAVTVTVAAAAGTNAVSGDYTLSSATTLTIAAGSTTSAGAVTVTAVNNDTDSPDKSVTVSGTASDSLGLANDPPPAALTLVDDETLPTVALALSPASISENAGVSTVTATLSGASSAAVTITVSAAAGAGAVSGDYRLSSATTLTIAAGSTTSAGSVTITANDNDMDAPDKSVTVSATVEGGNGAAAPSDATLTIADNDEKGLALVPSDHLAVTAGGTAGSYMAELTSEPTGTVMVTVTSDNADVTVNPASLTFDATNWDTAQPVTVTAAADGDDYADAASLTHDATGGGYDGVAASLLVSVKGETAIRTDGASGKRTYFIEGRRVEVTVEAGVPEGIVVDFAGVEAVEATTITMTISPNVPEATVERAADDGFNLGPDDPEEPRMVVDIEVVNAPGVRVCLPVNAAVVAGARDTGRLRLLRYDGSVWAPVAGYEYDAAMARICASGVTSFSPFAVGYVDTRPEFAGDFAGTAMVFTVDEAIDPAVPLPKATGGDGTLRYTLTPALPPGLSFDEATRTLSGTPAEAFPETDYTWTVTDIDGEEDKLEFSVAAASEGTGTIADDDEKGLAFARAEDEDPDFDRSRVLEVTEGGAASYTVKLTSEPTAQVTVTVGGSGRVTVDTDGDANGDQNTLTFDATTWNAAQTVTVTAPNDGNDYAEPASVSHTASGGGYGEESGSLQVSVEGETRVRVSGATGPTLYVIDRRRVTVTVGDGVPPGIEVDFGRLGEGPALTLTFKPVGDEVPRESGSFSLAHGDERAMVDVNVVPMPDEGVELCLMPPAGMRDAAGRVSGRGVKLLRYADGSWTAVTNSDLDDWDESRSRVCATVEETSPFAAGYANTKPKFDTTQKDLVFTVDEEIDPPETLPEAKGGDGTLRYALTPDLPPGVKLRDRLLFGTPEKESGRVTYTWTATDGDDETVSLTFDIEVKWNLEKARARLKEINESILPELSRAMWGSVVDAVTGRLEGSGGGMADTAAAALKAQERTQDEEGLSWRKALEGRTFAVALGAGGVGSGGSGDLVVWGGGSRQSLSLDKAALDWSGDLFSAHMGFDGPLGENLRGGLAVSRFEGSIEYTDRNGETAVAGVHESRMTAAHPYAGWSGPGGSRLWGALGYGAGEIEITDAEVVRVQQADSAFLAAALGGSVPVLSADGLTLALKASGEATRYSVDDNGKAIAKVSVGTHRLRLSAEGGRAYALPDGGTLAPSLELGVRWDGGDGETGAGVEAGGGLEWSLPGLTVAARGRTLAAHEGALKEWGAGGSIRLDPADGRGLSLRLEPRWGATESGLGRLWDEGVPGRPTDGGGDEARLETELGYGLPALGGAGVTTPYAGFGLAQGGQRDIRAGVRLGLGAGFDLGIEAERRENAADTGHGIGIDLRIRW